MRRDSATLGGDGTVLFCNARLAEMLHVPLERLMGAPLERFVPPASREAYQALLRQAAAGGESRAEVDLGGPGGQPLPAFLSASAILSIDTSTGDLDCPYELPRLMGLTKQGNGVLTLRERGVFGNMVVYNGALNLYVAWHYSETVWVNFKLFGTLGAMLLFVLAQSLWLSRHLEEERSDA